MTKSKPTSLRVLFPKVDPGLTPLSARVLVQMRRSPEKTQGGIILASTTQDIEKHNTQIAKVIALGPIAFRDRQTLEEWPEGAWTKPGEFVRVPLYGGDRWEVEAPDGKGKVLFAIFKDHNVIGKVTGDPRQGLSV